MTRKFLATALFLVASSLSVIDARSRQASAADTGWRASLDTQRFGRAHEDFLELYVAALYLTRPSNNAAEIILADEPMAIRIKITSGFVSQSSLVDSLEEGFQKATGGDTREIRQEIDQFRVFFKEAINKSDVFDMVYVPQYGVIVNKNGKLKGTVAGVRFKQALFSIWLSDKPADSALKQALLTPATVR